MPPSHIDHIGIPVPLDKFETIVEWYKQALKPLKYIEMMRVSGVVGMGVADDGAPDFWIMGKESCHMQGIHIAFSASGELGKSITPSLSFFFFFWLWIPWRKERRETKNETC